MTALLPAQAPELGLRANLAQFSLLVVVNAFVGAMVGMERSILPGPSLQVRTRPAFSVVTRPACSRTPTCFFMPVRVMLNFSASVVIEASSRPSCSRTPRRVASDSAEKETSRRVDKW